MSLATLPLAAGDFDGWDDNPQFAAIVDGFDRPVPKPNRPARPTEKCEALDESRGFRRHRTRRWEQS